MSKPKTKVYYLNEKVVYASTSEGHFTTDSSFLLYLVMRKEVPAKVVLYDRLKDLKAAFLAQGVEI
jgi:hypothetical protein